MLKMEKKMEFLSRIIIQKKSDLRHLSHVPN